MTDHLYYTVTDGNLTARLRFYVNSPALSGSQWNEIQRGKQWEYRENNISCTVIIKQDNRFCTYQLTIDNKSPVPVEIENFSIGPESVNWEKGITSPHALYSLHPRVTGVNDYDAEKVQGLPPFAALPKNEWHELSERCPELPHLEGLVLNGGWNEPSFIEGPLTQNHAHQRKKIRWTGDNTIRFDIVHRFLGIPAKILAPGEKISESGFIQFYPDGNLNNVLRDYLSALGASTGSREKLNPLIKERFFCTWNNFIYWEANEKEIIPSVQMVKQKLPSIQWYLLDDGYMVSEGSESVLNRNGNGERVYSLEKELPWFHDCPGISFLFDGGEGVDYEKFPTGLDGFAAKTKSLGMRPGIWIGMEVSRNAPAAIRHPEWFIDIGHESHLLPDLSVPEVREQLIKAFRTLFQDWGYEAVKIDFVTHLTDNPEIRYRNRDKSGAEWRDWLYRTIRSFLPEDGFITIGCWICMGAPWLAPYADSYRDSMDARDGNWQTVLSNVRWSIVPALSGDSGQPIPDADSISVFKGMEQTAMQTWINYARVGGMLTEAGGDIQHWSDKDTSWVEQSLADDRSGGRVYFADKEFWSRDGLPCASYRAINERTFIVGLYNWEETTREIHPEWIGPIEKCEVFTSLESGEQFTPQQLSAVSLPARGSGLYLADIFGSE